MTIKSLSRRGAVVTAAVFSAFALTACGAGQISQTANQVAAVDGAQNPAQSSPSGVAIRDVQIVVDPNTDTAALKFSVSNQERKTGAEYTLLSVNVEGAGEVEITPRGESPTFRRDSGADGSLTFARECQIVADSAEGLVTQMKGFEGNPSCVAYFETSLPSDTLIGVNGNASGENRNVTFRFDGPDGQFEETLFVTISANIPEAGKPIREADGVAVDTESDPGTLGPLQTRTTTPTDSFLDSGNRVVSR